MTGDDTSTHGPDRDGVGHGRDAALEQRSYQRHVERGDPGRHPQHQKQYNKGIHPKINSPDPGKSSEILDYHARILDAIRAGDAARAEAQLRGHLTGTLARVDAIMEKNPGFF